MVWLTYGIIHHLQQYFSHIVVVSFSGGGNRSTRRKPRDLWQVADRRICDYAINDRNEQYKELFIMSSIVQFKTNN